MTCNHPAMYKLTRMSCKNTTTLGQMQFLRLMVHKEFMAIDSPPFVQLFSEPVSNSGKDDQKEVGLPERIL